MNPPPMSATAKLSQPGAARDVDPIVLQIVEGTLNSIEAEIEYAIERTARSPMIREAHDYRVGLFDRYCRKLTGRSYSAMPHAVVRDFPPHTMRPPFFTARNATGTSAPTGAKMMAASSGSGGASSEPAAHRAPRARAKS